MDSAVDAWTDKDITQLRLLAAAATPAAMIGLKLSRTTAAVTTKASQLGLNVGPLVAS